MQDNRRALWDTVGRAQAAKGQGNQRNQLGGRLDIVLRAWDSGRPAVMGILNLTPDSFYDGGRYTNHEAAVRRGLQMAEEGAEIIDLGGESTRPGSDGVDAQEELRRILPTLKTLRQKLPHLVISIDTRKPEVAEACLAEGADLINDVGGGRNTELLKLVRRYDAAIILMHMRGSPKTMQTNPHYVHPQAEVAFFLRRKAEKAVATGIPPEKVWVDPGIGFGKDDRANLSLLAHLRELELLGHPVVVGASRKSFIGRLTGAPVKERLPGSLAALVPTLFCRKAVVRVHDVAQTLQFLKVAQAILEARQ